MAETVEEGLLEKEGLTPCVTGVGTGRAEGKTECSKLENSTDGPRWRVV